MCVNLSSCVVTLRRTGKTVVVQVPCGHCIECLKKRQNDWKLRIAHECAEWSHCYFFTLTYKNDMLPCRVVNRDEFGCVHYSGTFPDCQKFVDRFPFCDLEIVSSANKSEIQAFIKRMREDIVRKYYNDGRWPMKYFICAEYGPNPRGTKRPHYHGVILCNDAPEVLKPYFNLWEIIIGRIDFQEVGIGREDRSSVANYISKYCAKGCFESRKEDIDHCLIEKAWTIMSKNIGGEWLKAHKQDYLRHVPTCLSIDGDWSLEDIEAFFATPPQFSEDTYNLYKRLFPNHDLKDFETYESHWELRRVVIDELDSLIRNMRVFDGEVHGYKMPRYYFDRIINKPVYYERLTPTDKPNLNLYHGEYTQPHFCFFYVPEAITYETLVSRDKRYVPESFLSRALTYRLRMLAIERSRRLADKLTSDYGYTIAQADSEVLRNQTFALKYREQSAMLSLQSFYVTNMWNHREFDE